MKENTNKWAATVGLRLLAVTLTLACGTIAATAKNTTHIVGYRQINLVSDLPRLAQLVDTNLLNPWGFSFSGTGPFWVSDNGAGLVTLYTVTNRGTSTQVVTKEGLEVAIPGEGAPTGQLFDGTGAFNGDVFIFAGEDGTISGWKGSLGGAAELLASRSNAVYKGITLVTNTGSPLLLLANFREGTIDAYDTSFNLVQYADTNVPAGYAPFNVQTVGGFVFVTFAKQDAAQHDDVAGAGNGLIEIFDVTGGTFHRFATGTSVGGTLSAINSPWGMTLAPATFGPAGDKLLVGNFGSGTIMVFEANGQFDGLLERTPNHPVTINGLWGLSFGNGGRAGLRNALYFTAGLNHEADGLFGSIVPQSMAHGRGH